MSAEENNAVVPRAAEETFRRLTPMLTSAGRGWTGIGLTQYTGYVDEVDIPPSQDHVAAVYLGHSPADIRLRLDGQLHEERFYKGEIAIVSAGRSFEGAWKRRADDALEMRLTDTFLREVAQSV